MARRTLTIRLLCVALSGLPLSLCAPISTLASPPDHHRMVMKDEYVVTLSRGSFGAPGKLVTNSSPHFNPTVGHTEAVLDPHTLLVTAPVSEVSVMHAPDNREQHEPVPFEARLDACKRLMSDPQITSCSPNFIVHALDTTPNDPSFPDQWGLGSAQGLSAQRAWDLTTGSRAVVVAVLDTGIDYTHPDLAENMWHNPGEVDGNGLDDDQNGYVDDVYGINSISGAASPGDPLDDHYHGTHVAGIIGAVGNNGVGVVGVNHAVSIMALKFMGASGSGSVSDAIRAIDYMVTMARDRGINVRIVNNSWGGGGYSAPLENAIQRAKAAGIIFVAAAGNDSADNDSDPNYPAGYEVENVVSVAAVSKTQDLASFSNFGASTVDIAAPGVEILSTVPGRGYSTLSGTSMATPHVAGALALLFSHEPTLTYREAIDRLYLAGAERPSLQNSLTGVPLVRTQRTVHAARMLLNQTSPLPTPPADLAGCDYEFNGENLLSSGEADQAADQAPIINQSDEGDFYRVQLPFSFPFFRESIDTIWVSPNGVVHTKAPSAFDYSVGSRPPRNSIAALQADLTPRGIDQGARVAVAPDKVTVMWRSEHYNHPGEGVIIIRLTIKSDGTFYSSVHFGEDGSLLSLQRQILGDPFAAPSTPAVSLIGVGGATTSFSSKLDLELTQLSLLSPAAPSLALRTTMANGCSAGPPQSGDPNPEVLTIELAKGRQTVRWTPLTITFTGTGSGEVPVLFRVNNVDCSPSATVTLSEGDGRLLTFVPDGVRRLTVQASASVARTRIQPRSRRTETLAARGLCRRILRNVTAP